MTLIRQLPTLAVAMIAPTACAKERTHIPRSDSVLLEQLYADTWSCLDAMIDLTGLNAIELELSLLSSDVKDPGTLRLLVIDQHDQERFATLQLKQDQSTYRITADELLGIHLDEEQVTRIYLEAWTNPWFYSDKKLLAKQLSLELKAVRIDLE